MNSETFENMFEELNMPSARIAVIEDTTSIGLASGSFLGFAVCRASTSVRRNR